MDYCRRAQARGADLVVFPELWNIGCALRASPAEQHRWNSAAIDQQSHFFRGFVSAARDLEVNIALTYLSSAQPRPRNTVAILNRSGEVVLTYSKVCICDFEPDDGEEVGCDVNCAPGNSFPVCTLTARDGDRVHVGAMICADREFPEPASRLMRNGAELIIVPNACDWDDVRSSGLLTRAVENLVVVAMANYPRPKANGNSRAYSCVTWKGGGPENPLIAVAGEQEELLIAEFDLAEIRAFRKAEAWRLKHRSQLDSQRETVRPKGRS